jgi:deoxyadenosine/deoxycytidine kinase
MQRIAQRDRPYERMMEVDYIDTLNHTYETFLGKKSGKNILVINTNDLDFVRLPEDLEYVEGRIRQALKLAPFQESLPIDL